MWKLKKIVETICIFVVSMLLICFLFSVYKYLQGDIAASQLLQETGLYFLYTIGYGSLEGDSLLQNIFAMIGIISLALMTTFLTINLFWRLDDVKMQERIEIDLDQQKMRFCFQNRGSAICDMKANFLLYDAKKSEGKQEKEEYYIPLMIKNSTWNVEVSTEDTFWYQALYQMLKDSSKKLYCTFSFVDTKSGQGSIKVEPITISQFYEVTGQPLSYESLVKPSLFPKSELKIIDNNEQIYTTDQNEFLQVDYTIKKKTTPFLMLYYNFHALPFNFEKYPKDSTYLEWSAYSKENMTITMEIKSPSATVYSFPMELTPTPKTFQIPFSEIDGNCQEITEICYTVFPQNNPKTNQIFLSDLKRITK